MDVLSELFGAAGVAGGLGALIIYLIKQGFKSLLTRSEQKSEKVFELQSHKQKALFDRRFNAYSDIYLKMMQLEGTIKTFENIEWMATSKIEGAFYSNANQEYLSHLDEEELQKRKSIYELKIDKRCIINFNYFIDLMSARKMDLNNSVVYEQNILKDPESLLFKKLIENIEDLIEKIGESYRKVYEEVGHSESEVCDRLQKRLNDELSTFFDKDLESINTIIRDIDNMFREDIHS